MEEFLCQPLANRSQLSRLLSVASRCLNVFFAIPDNPLKKQESRAEPSPRIGKKLTARVNLGLQ
jgi:hypothetical protein